MLYPAIYSIRAIQSPDANDDKHWLTYWIIFGGFNFLETFVGCILNWIPYFSYLRVILFSWLMLPQSQGAKWIYETFIAEAIENNKEMIDYMNEQCTMKNVVTVINDEIKRVDVVEV